MFITLKDGSKKEYQNGISVFEIIQGISEGLARNAVAAKLDGVFYDLQQNVDSDCAIEVLTFKEEEGKDVYRHTTSHILAQAVKNLYPDAKLGIGPSIKNGFYYDFDFSSNVTNNDIEKIEKEMEKIVKADYKIVRSEKSKAEALEFFNSRYEVYKAEMISELADGEKITFYQQGDYVDFCRGPHLFSTGKVKAFKLLSVTGAYWKGSEKNKMLTRIYGTAFDKKADLDQYIFELEEAKRRDHNKLGRELGFFMTDENIGQGLPLLMPKGAKVMQTLIRFVEDEEARRGYLYTRTPSMAKKDLYKISGHWDHYRDGMFIMNEDGAKENEDTIALRPMTCPFQFMMYKNGLKSYRELPVRYNETASLFRNENSGEMHGLIRVRQFTLSDGHLIVTPEQVEEEFKNVLDLIYYILECVGLREDVSFRFSKWDPNNTEKYINNPEAWESTQNTMRKILDHLGISYKEADGEAAFYGPKLDIQIRNVHGKEDTLITVQIDFALAERFDMWYVAEDGSYKRPMIIHRSSIGCYERTLALMIEKFAGALPTWIAPVQVKVLALTDRTAEDAKQLAKDLFNKYGIRAEADVRNEKVGYKIREAQLEKVPYMLVLGDKEKESGSVAVRARKEGDLGVMKTGEFIIRILEEINSHKVQGFQKSS